MLSFQFKVCSSIYTSFCTLLILIQRFEHPTSDKSTARKIETRVRFPASINMVDYTTHGMKPHGPASKANANQELPWVVSRPHPHPPR